MKSRKKKDVLFLCQFFYPEYISSAMLPFQTACAYAKQGLKVGALCGYPKEYSDKQVRRKEKKAGIEITRLKYIQLQRSNFFGRLINYFSFTTAVLLNIRKFRDYKYVIVYSNPPILPIAALLASKLYGCKIIFVAYDLYPEIAIKTDVLRDASIIAKVMKWINKELYSRAYRVVALSNDMRNFIIKNRSINSKRVIVIPNWDTTIKKNTKQHENQFAKEYEGKIVVSYLGNMGTCQDMETLLGAIRELKNDSRIQFLLAGHGNKKEKIEQIVKDENLENVKVLGFLQGQDFEDALNISTYSVVSLEKSLVGLCVPSKTYSYIEAGIPIIAIMEKSDLTEDIEKYKCGFWINNGDIRILAESLRKVVDNIDTVSRTDISKIKYNRADSVKAYLELVN